MFVEVLILCLIRVEIIQTDFIQLHCIFMIHFGIMSASSAIVAMLFATVRYCSLLLDLLLLVVVCLTA